MFFRAGANEFALAGHGLFRRQFFHRSKALGREAEFLFPLVKGIGWIGELGEQ